MQRIGTGRRGAGAANDMVLQRQQRERRDDGDAVRHQGFFGAARLTMGELEYTALLEKLDALGERLGVRG